MTENLTYFLQKKVFEKRSVLSFVFRKKVLLGLRTFCISWNNIVTCLVSKISLHLISRSIYSTFVPQKRFSVFLALLPRSARLLQWL